MGLTAYSACAGIRAQICCGLDGELSQLEQRILAAHLVKCPQCQEFERSVTSFTEAMRAAPPERLEQPIAIPSRRRVSLLQTKVGVAATLLVAVLGAASQLTGENAQRSPAFAQLEESVRFETTTELTREIEMILTGRNRHDVAPRGRAFPL